MEIKRDVALKEHTTFKIGGNADFFCKVTSKAELLEACRFAKEGNNPIFILGGGSNVLIQDDGFRGLVIQMDIAGILYDEREDSSASLTLGAGENWDNAVASSVKSNFFGLENLSGVPGSVGGAPVQNIGAYGVEVKNLIMEVEVFDISTEEFKLLSNKECLFDYRTSIFKRPEGKKYIIVAVTFKLHKNAPLVLEYPDLKKYFDNHPEIKPSLLKVREVVVEIRKNKLPDLKLVGTAGSFFKNPIITESDFFSLKEKFPNLPGFKVGVDLYKLSAGWLIDHIGNFKAYRMGDVGMYEKQALVLVNYGSGSQSEIIQLAEMIENKIKEKTGIILEREVCIV